jgi:hypothetical protein
MPPARDYFVIAATPEPELHHDDREPPPAKLRLERNHHAEVMADLRQEFPLQRSTETSSTQGSRAPRREVQVAAFPAGGLSASL